MKLFSYLAALQIIDHVAVTLGQALMLARSRIASLPSPVLQMMAERDHAHSDAELLRRELEVFRAQRENMQPHKRPEYPPEQRLAILQIMRLRGWNAVVTAKRFVLHPNTVRAWVQAVEGRRESGRLLGDLPWNRVHDAVRWAVHELRRLCPEPEIGTRTIARHLLRSGIQISRSTVQRVSREEKPPSPRRSRAGMLEAAGAQPRHLLAPVSPNEVWHLDLAELRIVWFRYTIAALLDGYSRKLLAFKVYRGSPKSADLVGLMRDVIHRFGSPRFLITDHGCQFRWRFRTEVGELNVKVVRGRVRCPAFNGKVERFFKTFRIWQRRTLLPLTLTGIQRKLDAFHHWYNTERLHQGEVVHSRGRSILSGSARFSRESCSFPLVVVEQSAEVCVAADRTEFIIRRWGRGLPHSVQLHVAQRLVRAQHIIIVRVDLYDVVQVPQAEAEELIQALSLQCPNPRFDEAVGDRRLVGCPDDRPNGVIEEGVELLRELGVTVMNEKVKAQAFVLQPHDHIPRLLLHPLADRMIRYGTHKHPVLPRWMNTRQ